MYHVLVIVTVFVGIITFNNGNPGLFIKKKEEEEEETVSQDVEIEDQPLALDKVRVTQRKKANPTLISTSCFFPFPFLSFPF